MLKQGGGKHTQGKNPPSTTSAAGRGKRSQGHEARAKEELNSKETQRAQAAMTNQVNSLVKDLRRSAHALRSPAASAASTPASFFSDALWPAVKAFMERRYRAHRERGLAACSPSSSSSCPRATPLRVRLVGLGIGPFSRKESRTSFLQMATLVALRGACVDCLAQWTAKDKDDEKESPVAVVETCFFEPLAIDAFHGECCRRLGITMESENRVGAYSPASCGNEVLILFMPHCPWVLVHNTLLASWPSSAPSTPQAASAGDIPGEETATVAAQAATRVEDTRDVLPLRNLLLIANDLRNTPLIVSSEAAGRVKPWTVSSQALRSVLDFTPLCPSVTNREKKKYKNNNTAAVPWAAAVVAADRPESHEEDTAGLSGLSRNDVVDALLDITVMSLADTHTDAEVRETLCRDGKGRSHAIIRKAPELIQPIEGRPRKSQPK